MSLRVLVIDDQADVRALIEGRLTRRGLQVRAAEDGEQALRLAREFDPQVAVTDLRMPGLDGFEVLKRLRVPTILITGHGDKESAIRAVEAGAFAFFEKPFDLDALEIAIQRAGERQALEFEREQLLRKLDRLVTLQGRELESWDRKAQSAFTGEHARIREVKQLLARLAPKPQAGLLILGETGTGKEVVARELHRLTHPGERAPFLALNCSAIPADLLESELFGHEKGAFSGAHATRVGLAEAVREGTLFLDEIGELDPRHQAKVLRLLQERAFRRVGANHESKFQGRIVAATHRDLPALSKTGRFREDLYYRLAVITVTMPPLRERGTDIRLLADNLCRKHGLQGLATSALEQALFYQWPGNVRELNNWIERAAILGLHDDEGFVTAPPMPAVASVFAEATGTAASAAPDAITALAEQTGDLKELRARVLDEYDRRWIRQALAAHSDNITAAAKTLGLDRKNLARRMKDLGLKKAA